MFKKTALTIAFSALLALQGCLSTSSSQEGQVDPELEKSSSHFFSKSGITAGLVGAGAGVLACLVSNADNKLACSAIAGTAGFVVGISANYVFDNIKNNYKNTEDQLNAAIDIAQKDVDEIKNMTETTKSVMEKDKAQLAKINSNIAKGTASKKDLNKKLADVNANIAYCRDTLKNIDDKIVSHENARKELGEQGANKSELQAYDKKIAELKERRADLLAAIDSYQKYNVGLAA